VVIGRGFYLCLFAAGGAVISCISFYLDFKDLCDCCATNDFQHGKSTVDDAHMCTCFLLTGSGTSGYDGTKQSLEKTSKVTKENDR
jgi:hypothetical protein